MTRVQQSIEISVPVHTAYHQLTQFEDYPHFMQDVETVHQLDDTHLRWSTKLSYQTLEWDAEITEQLPDRCIAWRNLSGPSKAGKVELQPLGSEKARVTFTMECEPSEILAAPEGNAEAVMAQQLEQDLARFKAFIETRGAQAGSAPVPTSSYAAGSEGWDGNEDPAEPALSSARNAATRLDEKKQNTPSEKHSPSSSVAEPQADHTMQSAAALSQSSDDGQFSVAEEQNFDQQSDQVRHVGQMPLDLDAPVPGENKPSEAMAKSMKQGKDEAKDESKDEMRLKKAIERTVPPSE
jgi:hypothetical protein